MADETAAWKAPRRARQPKADAVPLVDGPVGDAYRVDGWLNFATGMGLLSRDKGSRSFVIATRLAYETIEETYRGSDFAARAIDDLPAEALREGFEINVQGDRALAEAVAARCDEMEVESSFLQGWQWGRAFGGGALLLGVDDGQQDLTLALNEDNIRSFRWMSVLDRRDILPATFYSNPYHPKYGQPAVYRLQPMYGEQAALLDKRRMVHETRIIRFEGVQTSRRQVREQWGWGDSVLVRIYEVLQSTANAYGGGAALLGDFAQGVFGIKDLTKTVATAAGQQALNTRLGVLDFMRSVLRAMVVDKDNETFERKPTPISGFPEMLDKLALRLAAACDMPMARLFGQPSAGLNAGAGAQTDQDFWDDKVKSAQKKILKPRLNRLLKLLLRSKDGPTRGVEPEKWSVSFRPLRQLTAPQKADIRLKTSQADALDIQNQVITPDEAAVSHFSGPEYSPEIHLDTSSRDAMASGGTDDPAAQNEAEAAPEEGAPRGTAQTTVIEPAEVKTTNAAPVADAARGHRSHRAVDHMVTR